MHQTGSVTEGRAQQTWYRCPACAATQTVSQPSQAAQPYRAALQRIGDLLRCSYSADGHALPARHRGLY